MKISNRHLRALIREEIEANIDEMALGKTSYYHDLEEPGSLGVTGPYSQRPVKKHTSALPMSAKYMERAKMQLDRFPLPVNVIWLEGSVNHLDTRTLHRPGSAVSNAFVRLHEKRHGSSPDPSDFNVLITAGFVNDLRGPEKINYSVHNSFHQLFDGGPFNNDYATPLQQLAYQYVERVRPDIADLAEFQDAQSAVMAGDYENFVDYDNMLGEEYAPDFKRIFSKIFQGRTIRLGIATSIREICNEALTLSLMAQINPVRVGADSENSDLLIEMAKIAEGVPLLAQGLAGMTLYAGL